MAGIILDINDDIKRLQQLKAEIESVKKALTSINVKVDIDIAKGLEARLQKLTGQYDALVGKIAVSEAKVKEAESRMNSATQRITEAQERVAKSAGGQGGAGANPASAGVQAQVRAYEELERQIDGVLGTRDENVKLMVREQNAIRMINALIKETKKNEMGSDGVVSQRGMRLLEKYNNDLLTHKAALSQVRQELLNQAKLNNAAGTSMNALSQSLARMRIAYRELTEEERRSPFGQELLASIQQADAKIKELDATIGNHQRNVGNYASGWNGLGMSVQQIVRELPAATMGLNMFFLAISNNLPILTDEIKRAVEMNKQLKASNQDTVPVWKQLVSSIFSWQTAMMVAITVMSMYGKEIVSWIGNLFKVKDATEEVRIEQEKLNKSMADARKSAAEETAGLRTLYAMTQNQNASMQDRLAAVNKLQQQYPAYFGNISKEAILAGQASAAYQQLTKDIMAAAYARAYQDRISDLAAKNIDNYNKSLSQYNYLKPRQGAYDAAKQREERRAQLRELMDKEGLVWRSEYADEWAELRKLQDGDRTLIKQFNKHHELWENANKDYQRIEKSIEGYQSQALKYQKALMKTEQGSDYVEDTKSQENEAKRIAKERERIAKERLKAQSDIDKDLLALKQKNIDDGIALQKEGTKKRLAEIKNDHKKRIAEIDKQEAEFKKKNKEAGITGLGAEGLTDEQQNALKEAADNAAKERERQTQEVYAAEAQAMRDYLKEYGTFQQQKLAIAEEYAEKIRNAQNEGERLSLTAEHNRAVQQVEINAIKQNIDWGSVFGDFGTMFRDQLQPTIDRLRQIAGSDTFKQSSLEEQQVLYELIEKLENANAAWGSDIFKRVSDDMKAYQEAMRGYAEAMEAARVAEGNLAKARKERDEAEKAGDAETIAQAEAGVKAAQKEFDTASGEVRKFGSQVQETTSALNSSAAQAKSMFDNLAGGLQGLASGSLQGIGQGVMSLDRLFGGNVTKDAGNALAKGFQSLLGKDSKASKALTEALGQSGMAGEIISAVLGMLDLIADKGISGIATSLQDTVLGAVDGILKDITSGDIITKPLANAITGVGSILDTLTFGGFSSWVGNGESDPTYAEDMARLAESNRDLETAIDNLADKMENSSVAEAPGIYEMQRESVEQEMANLQEMMRRSGAASSNGFLGIGSEHSSDYKINEGMSAADWQAVSKAAGESVRTAQEFWTLTSEQMSDVATYATTQYSKIKGLADDGHENAAQFMDEYIGKWQELEELQDAYNEKMTSVSFDTLRDNFRSALLDMDDATEAFAENFEKMMRQAVVEAMMTDMFDEQLRQWYENFVEKMKDGQLDKDEQDALLSEWNTIVSGAKDMYGMMRDTMDWDGTADSSQSGSQGSFETMSQDQASELSGRFTAVYEGEVRIEQGMATQTQAITEIRGTVAELAAQSVRMYSIADETRSILANSYLELREISENTGAIIKPIKQIQADMAAVKQNTSRI